MKTLEGISMEIPMKCMDSGLCVGCPLYVEGEGFEDCIKTLATEVQRLRDERESNPGVWDAAPEWAKYCYVVYSDESAIQQCSGNYTRALPKTIEQEIAEEYVNNRKKAKPAVVSWESIEKEIVELLNTYKARIEADK